MGSVQQVLLSLKKSGFGGTQPVTSGLQAEYSGRTLSGTTGTTIGTWADESGNGNDLTQGTEANKPLVVSPGLNGIRTAKWNDGDESMGFTSSIALTNLSLFAVVKGIDSGSVRSIFGAASGGPQFRYNASRFSNLLKAAVADLGASSASKTDSVWYTVAVTYSSPNVAFYLNGSTDGTASNAATFSSNMTLVGKSGSAEFWLGEMAHLVVYNRVLNSTEITDELAYLQEIWAHY